MLCLNLPQTIARAALVPSEPLRVAAKEHRLKLWVITRRENGQTRHRHDVLLNFFLT